MYSSALKKKCNYIPNIQLVYFLKEAKDKNKSSFIIRPIFKLDILTLSLFLTFKTSLHDLLQAM